jgi:RluA family pseudouridine synthase
MEQPTILYQDDDILVANKPSGILTEGGASLDSNLESWALEKIGRPVRCCHRLDRGTSGVVILRKNNRFTRELAEIFASRRIRKSYWAITNGIWPGEATKLEHQLSAAGNGRFKIVQTGGKIAQTSVRIIATNRVTEYSWLQLLLKTGRTHQARVQCAHVGCPILGDLSYGSAEIAGFFGLHAREIRFRHPLSHESLVIEAPPPGSWKPYLDEFAGKIKSTKHDSTPLG